MYELGKTISLFPFSKNKLSQIKELVNKATLAEEDPYRVYLIPKSCKYQVCHDNCVIVSEVVIGNLGNKLLDFGVKSACILMLWLCWNQV